MSKPGILAVDDEPAILELLALALERERYGIDMAGSVGEFRGRVRQVDCDLFIIDLTLPDGNGLNLIREIRPDTRAGIIILTGRGKRRIRVSAFKPARVNAPYRRTSALRAATPAPVESASNGPSVDHEFAGCKVSCGARRVWGTQGEEIFLTTAEFSVLLAFPKRRGRVLTRDQIMTLARGRDWESCDRVVDGLVGRLRKKLPKPSGNGHFIRTVHNVGHVFGG